jgi:hypothetical protein
MLWYSANPTEGLRFCIMAASHTQPNPCVDALLAHPCPRETPSSLSSLGMQMLISLTLASQSSAFRDSKRIPGQRYKPLRPPQRGLTPLEVEGDEEQKSHKDFPTSAGQRQCAGVSVASSTKPHKHRHAPGTYSTCNRLGSDPSCPR